MDSILTSIKKLLGIQSDYTHFDPDLVMCINTALSVLTQLGVGPKYGLTITGDGSTWHDFVKDDSRLEMIKSFVHLRVRLLFDPPQNASLAEAIEKMAKELEWRIQVVADEVGESDPSILPPVDDKYIATDAEVRDMLDDVLG